MATQEIPPGNGIKDISVPMSSAYIKIAEKNGSRLLPGRSILSTANFIPSIFQISPLCLKCRTSFSGDNGEDRGQAIPTKQANKRRTKKRGRIKRQGWSGGEENERQMANNVMREIRVCDGYLVCWVLRRLWQRRQKSFLLPLEHCVGFPLKRKGWCNKAA